MKVEKSVCKKEICFICRKRKHPCSGVNESCLPHQKKWFKWSFCSAVGSCISFLTLPCQYFPRWSDGWLLLQNLLAILTFPVHHPKLKDSLFSLAWILLPFYILTLKKVLKECLLLNFKFPVSFYFPEMTMAFQNSPFLIGALAPILLLFKCHLTQMKLLRFIWL